MLKKLKSGKWQYRWRDRNRKQRAKNFRTKEQAHAFARELDRGEEPEQETRLTFATFADRWHREYCQIEKAESQWVEDLSVIRFHLLPAFGTKRLTELSKLDLLALRGRLKGELGLRPKTVNNIVGLARKILSTAVEWDLLTANPFAGIKPLKVPEQPYDYWTPAERDQFLRFCKSTDPELWEVVQFACHTGMRMGEIQGLKRGSLDFEQKMIRVTEAYSVRVKRQLPYTKSKRVREVPMNAAVLEVLQTRRLMAHTSPVFTVRLLNIKRRVARVAKAAGVRVIRFHDFRHTFASNLSMAGVSMQEIQRLVGHADIRETQRYAHFHPSHLKGLTDCLVSANNADSRGFRDVSSGN